MKLNLASGQRPYPEPWINIDIRDQGYKVDIVADIKDLTMVYDGVVEVMVGHHVFEHIPLHEQESYVREWWRVLKPGGKVLLAVPNMRAIAQRWLEGSIDTFTFAVNASGAWQGHITDLHRWQYDQKELIDRFCCWDGNKQKFNWTVRIINNPSELGPEYAGADIAYDWWILLVEFTKPV